MNKTIYYYFFWIIQGVSLYLNTLFLFINLFHIVFDPWFANESYNLYIKFSKILIIYNLQMMAFTIHMYWIQSTRLGCCYFTALNKARVRDISVHLYYPEKLHYQRMWWHIWETSCQGMVYICIKWMQGFELFRVTQVIDLVLCFFIQWATSVQQ